MSQLDENEIVEQVNDSFDKALGNVKREVDGDGDAVLITDGNEEEYDEFVKEQSGWGKFYKIIKKL